jgi:hypothetical protein
MCIQAKRKAHAFKQAPDIKIRADYKVLRNNSRLAITTPPIAIDLLFLRF